MRWIAFETAVWMSPWCGPVTCAGAEIDLRVGGRYRYIWQNKETGGRFGSYGEHLEIVTLERIVTSEVMDGLAQKILKNEIAAGDTAEGTASPGGGPAWKPGRSRSQIRFSPACMSLRPP